MLTAKAIDACREQRRRDPGHRRRGRGQLPAAGPGRGALRQARHHALRVPRPGLCTDNGAMVAALGVAPRRGRRRTPGTLGLPADSAMPITLVTA